MMRPQNHRVFPNTDVVHRMRAPYPAALGVERYTYRSWEVDLVTYDKETWVAYIFGAGLPEGKRLQYFASGLSALTEAQHFIDALIEQGLTAPPPEKKTRGTKRPKRKPKKETT